MPEQAAWWLSWVHLKKDGPFELHWPWWVSGYTSDDDDTICAAVRADDEDAARALIHAAYDRSPMILHWRFIDPLNGSPYTRRFQKADWMPEWKEGGDDA
jgi:hypothetical protein